MWVWQNRWVISKHRFPIESFSEDRLSAKNMYKAYFAQEDMPKEAKFVSFCVIERNMTSKDGVSCYGSVKNETFERKYDF